LKFSFYAGALILVCAVQGGEVKKEEVEKSESLTEFGKTKTKIELQTLRL
jgi:hypothetical protein